MKKTFLIIGIVLILLNTIIGALFSSYQEYNVGLVDISIILTTALLYSLVESKIADGFRIGLTVLFSITGFIRVVCALSSNENVKDNWSILLLLVILAFELICFVVSKFLDNK
jgi:hypothetical protein